MKKLILLCCIPLALLGQTRPELLAMKSAIKEVEANVRYQLPNVRYAPYGIRHTVWYEYSNVSYLDYQQQGFPSKAEVERVVEQALYDIYKLIANVHAQPGYKHKATAYQVAMYWRYAIVQFYHETPEMTAYCEAVTKEYDKYLAKPQAK